MKFIDGKLYLTIQQCVECGMNYRTITDAKDKGSNCWDIIDDPADKRKVLVGFEALNDDRKEKVERRFGNVYDRVARMPILNLVVNDWKANEHYMRHRYDNGTKSLHHSRVSQYTRGASWLNMLNEAMADKQFVKKELKLKMTEFFVHVASLINVEKERGKLEGYAGIDVLPGDFPSSYQRLLTKMERYKTEGYDHLIDALYGNKNAAKLGKSNGSMAQWLDDSMEEPQGLLTGGDGVNDGNLPVAAGKSDQKSANRGGAFAVELYNKQMAVIRAIARKHNNFDAGQVAEMANLLFSVNQWKTVSVATVRNIMNENEHLLIAGRRGKRAYMDKQAMQNKRKAPPFPMVYWTLDGWTAELMYQEQGPKGPEYKRLVLVVVLDAYNKYPIGYAIGHRENTDLIRQACRNALGHVYELFGTMYNPLQLQSDRYQVKNLTPFYQAVGKLYTPAEAHNSKAKVIEPYFRYLNKKYAQMTEFWTGFNVDSKKGNQVNREMLDLIKNQAPDRAGVIRQIERMMSRERAAKVEQYISQWALMPAADKCVMNEMNYLLAIGTQLGDKTCKITGQGIEKQIDGVKYFYDSFDPAFRANMGIDWMLWGDKDNLTKVVAVSPDNKLKFVLDEKRILPMDLYSTTQADVDYRMRVKNFNKDRMAEITELGAQDARVVAEIMENTPFVLNDDSEMDLKLLLTYKGQQKEKIQDAKGLQKGRRMLEKANVTEQQVAASEWDKKRLEYLKEI